MLGGHITVTKQLAGKPLARMLEASIQQEVTTLRHRGTQVKMVTLLVDGDKASYLYALQKGKLAHTLGIEYELRRFPASVSEGTLIEFIHKLNQNAHVHGIMLELPLPAQLSTTAVIAAISPAKDVDGLTPTNREANLTGAPGIYPATPTACISLLEHYGYSVAGKHVALVGCGKTVGMPLLHLLLRIGATVTTCHAGTRDLGVHILQADILIVAAGKANLITPEMVHANLIVIDAGINQTVHQEIVGDVAPAAAKAVAAISPTPGGVGVITTRQLFANLMQAVKLQQIHRQPITV